jgi:branched-chain amino acid transport system ATP-binding protein
MLTARSVSVRFGGLTAIDGVDLVIPECGIFALVGPNGAGKTTFLNVLTRVCSATEGTITLDGVDLLCLKTHEVIRHGITRSFQHAELIPGLTVLENILIGLHTKISVGIEGALMLPWTRRRETAACESSEKLLRKLDLWQFHDLRPADLPYGVQKLVDVARALISGPKLMLLDEPFAGLGESEVPRLAECIIAAARQCAVLMVEHHLELVMQMAKRVTVMNFGRKIAEGEPAEVCADPAVISCYLGTRRSVSNPRQRC